MGEWYAASHFKNKTSSRFVLVGMYVCMVFFSFLTCPSLLIDSFPTPILYSHIRKTKATIAAKALGPANRSWTPAAALLLLEPVSQLWEKSEVSVDWQSELEELEVLPEELLLLLLLLPSFVPEFPTPPLLSPGIEGAVEPALLAEAEAELAPASISRPVASKLAITVEFLPFTTVLLVPEMLS